MTSRIPVNFSHAFLSEVMEWSEKPDDGWLVFFVKKFISEIAYLLIIPYAVMETIVRLFLGLCYTLVMILPKALQQPVYSVTIEPGLGGMCASFFAIFISFASLFLNFTPMNKSDFMHKIL